MALRAGLYVRQLSIAATCLLLISAPAKADDVLKQAYVLTESLDADAVKCGLTTDLLQSHAEKALQGNSIVISHSEHDDVMVAYVNVTVVRENENYCAANVDVQFYSAGYEDIPGTNFVQPVKNVYCDKGTLLLGGTDRLTARVAEAVEEYAGQCVAQITRQATKRG